MTELLTMEEAYKAMVVFLDRYYERGGKEDSLGSLLGDISAMVWSDGAPNDPAQWLDWLDAIKEVRTQG